jgi:hypothetical protein
MMIDFAIEARAPGQRARRDPPRLPAALPPDHDDHRRGLLGALPLALGTGIGSNCAARWASPSSAACCCRSWSRCTPRR